MLWRARQFEFRFPRPTLVMGVLNVTPDSFSDGGRYLAPEAAVARGLELVSEGADILDVGGESSRPGAPTVPEDEERRRVVPVVRELARQVAVPISVDTTKASVAAESLEAGASIINDITAARGDGRMAGLVAAAGAGFVAMHLQGTPATMQDAPRYHDVVSEVAEFLRVALDRLQGQEVAEEQVVLDVGIGFGKDLGHNLELLAHLARFRELRRPLLLGVSRKSFIGKVLHAPVERRLPGSLAATCLAVAEGIHLVRTHDVVETVQALRVTEAILARKA